MRRRAREATDRDNKATLAPRRLSVISILSPRARSFALSLFKQLISVAHHTSHLHSASDVSPCCLWLHEGRRGGC